MQLIPSSIETDYWSVLSPAEDRSAPAPVSEMLVAGHVILEQLRREHSEWKRRVELGEQDFRTLDGEAWQRRFRTWWIATRRWLTIAQDSPVRAEACGHDLGILEADIAAVEPALGIRLEQIDEWMREIESRAACVAELPQLFSLHDSTSSH